MPPLSHIRQCRPLEGVPAVSCLVHAPFSHLCRPTNSPNAVLSFRLGTGKGGLRLAPAEDVVEFLGVQPGSLTPLALSAPSAGGIAFLLDAGVQAAPKIILHPLVNTASLTLTPLDLEVFLR